MPTDGWSILGAEVLHCQPVREEPPVAQRARVTFAPAEPSPAALDSAFTVGRVPAPSLSTGVAAWIFRSRSQVTHDGSPQGARDVVVHIFSFFQMRTKSSCVDRRYTHRNGGEVRPQSSRCPPPRGSGGSGHGCAPRSSWAGRCTRPSSPLPEPGPPSPSSRRSRCGCSGGRASGPSIPSSRGAARRPS